MAAKKKDPSETSDANAGTGSAQDIIEERRRAREEAVNTEGVETPPPSDVNETQS